MTNPRTPTLAKLFLLSACVLSSVAALPAYAQLNLTPGDLVVSIEGDGSNTGTYSDNQAAPLTLFQYALNGTSSAAQAGSLELPQTSSGLNYAISGEYGSSSEGTLQLSGNGQYLTLMGYGVNANAFNLNPSSYGGPAQNTALGQSGSAYVPRVVALISANGTVNTTTALNLFNENNPRSVYTANGTSFYVSGQGLSGDATGGVFYTTLGCTLTSCVTSITGTDGGSGASQDTREVQIYNNTLYVSSDSKSGSTNRSYIGTLGSPPSISVYNGSSGPTQLTGFGTSTTGKYGITSTNGNGINSAGEQINLSPENYFFANATTLYVADSGDPKQTSATSSLGDGGLQKWTYSSGNWTLDYTLSSGLGLVANSSTTGTSGLYGLTGKVVGNNVELFATSFSLTDTGATYLYAITDSLNATSESGETFAKLATAPADSDFKGVAFAPQGPSPVPLPAAAWLMLSGLGGFGVLARRKREV